MRNLTKPERNVLSCVPASTRAAFSNSQRIKATAADLHEYQAQTVEAVWLRLKESGLIEETVGFCRRTIEGDKAIERATSEAQQATSILPAMEGATA